MENVSKILILSASILISLMIISISVLIFHSFENPVAQTADRMSSDERNLFNFKFQKYESGRIIGLEAKALINIAMQNANKQLALEEKYRIPEIYISRDTEDIISLTRLEIISFDDASEFKEKFTNMLNIINNSLFYSIEVKIHAENGIVNKILINEL